MLYAVSFMQYLCEGVMALGGHDSPLQVAWVTSGVQDME
jgi:hypothetical protein